MDQSQREKEMREQYPDAFTHPELMPGEVFIGSQVVDVVYLNVGIYQQNGVASARVGNPTLGKLKGFDREFQFHPVFVNLHELIVAEEKIKKEEKGTQ